MKMWHNLGRIAPDMNGWRINKFGEVIAPNGLLATPFNPKDREVGGCKRYTMISMKLQNGKTIRRRVDRLMAAMFYTGNVVELKNIMVIHKDGNKGNNELDNLTFKEKIKNDY